MIKDADYQDLNKIAHCHIAAFNKSFSSKLGIAFVEETLKWYLSDNKKFLLFYEVDGICVGYCGGFVDDGTSATGSVSGMIQQAFGKAISGILMRPWLFFHPELRKSYPLILKNIKGRFKLAFNINNRKQLQPTKPKRKSKETVVGLVGIGVLPNYQGKGIGAALLKAFEERAKVLGYNKLSLSVLKNNTPAINSYTKNGFYIYSSSKDGLHMEKTI